LLRDNSKIKKFVSNLSTDPIIKKSSNRKTDLPTKAQWVASLLTLLLLGNSFLIIETLSQPRYHKLSPQEASAVLDSATVQTGDEIQKAQVEEMLAQGQLDILNGRALYPSFYRAAEGVADSDFALTMPLDFKRVTFYLIGPEAASLVLRVNNQQLDFPSGSDVLVLRCGSNALDAAAVVVMQTNRQSELIISSDLAAACPGLVS
jgi:hypothetical protein